MMRQLMFGCTTNYYLVKFGDDAAPPQLPILRPHKKTPQQITTTNDFCCYFGKRFLIKYPEQQQLFNMKPVIRPLHQSATDGGALEEPLNAAQQPTR